MRAINYFTKISCSAIEVRRIGNVRLRVRTFLAVEDTVCAYLNQTTVRFIADIGYLMWEQGIDLNAGNRVLCLCQLLYYADARDKIEQWRDDYNRHRPHSSLGDLTPVEFAESCIASGQPAADLQQYSKAISSVKFA